MSYNRCETRRDEERETWRGEGKADMYVPTVKWGDRGYKNVEENEQRLERNGTQNSAGMR